MPDTCRPFANAVVASVIVAAAGAWSPAHGELVFLTTGRVVSVERCDTVGGGRVRLALRGGGTIVFDHSLVARVEPDEIPAGPAATPAPLAPRSVGLDAIIKTAAARHGVDATLIRAVIAVESAFEPAAVSYKGAMGLMQLMPATAAQYAVDDPFDPGQNVDAGTRHLRTLLDRFDTSVALAAYNAGEGAVARFGGIPPYRETRAYVTRVLRLLE